jgi:glycosyltransferase involved in cell wall biosynthesis
MILENNPAPADARVWPEALALRDQGFVVSIISPKGEAEYRESYVCRDGIHIYRYGLRNGDSPASYVAEYSMALLSTFWLSLKVLLRHGFDVIHAANPPDIFFVIGLFYRLLGKRYVFDQHDLTPEMFQVLFGDTRRGPIPKVLHWLLLLFERLSYRTAALVIVTNESFRRIALMRGARDGNVVVVRNGPNLREMRRVTPDPALKQGRRYMLAYAGIIGAQDGVEYALYALHHLVHSRGRRDVSLVLMGDGAHGQALRALTHELALDDYVHLTGWIPRAEAVRYLTVADVGLSPEPANPLNTHSTMIKIMDYMALGIPIVAFDLIETRFSAQDAALYALPNSAEDYAHKIELLLDNDALRHRMGRLGRKRVEAGLSWEHSKRHLLQAYTHVLKGWHQAPENDLAPAQSYVERIS